MRQTRLGPDPSGFAVLAQMAENEWQRLDGVVGSPQLCCVVLSSPWSGSVNRSEPIHETGAKNGRVLELGWMNGGNLATDGTSSTLTSVFLSLLQRSTAGHWNAANLCLEGRRARSIPRGPGILVQSSCRQAQSVWRSQTHCVASFA
jgi:hypothetical protein